MPLTSETSVRKTRQWVNTFCYNKIII